ncbi:ArsR/SmtB family transcription factor [Campylobacter hyointestinalis]|uniref:Winged helix-turn-helix transcriptional regulator n=1 Tax=Campylobacter hyointestinalis subsp. lawsonii TaxID=91353 RepID=A0AAV6EH89_CAMHY|nr:metalloregulator ArsR/SmtB family transcription factor [Campylobacter hyointestinalis]ANE33860.1 transcriptional regulator, ArsR family [Campylobacter hyointestinalis subsp. lawsonii CCUG 27631]KAB0614218.1 winged helix-turn-helix transcriptional regulator [Campylobacter hyointestinalis subsp. lawsonii]QKF69964.1 transcriptional regulator, ArsR family [Campylobacter hyointestinalis subsp. lawsonii]RAZ27708.1 ArsR family transcriptional regulator [Campylobacter hyointestinalis subsp. lawsonii
MENLDDFLKITGALNDESRVKILAFLQKYGTLCVCDLQNSLQMIQSRLSRHLKILKDAGFLSVERKGVWAYYGLNENMNSHCKNALKEIRDIELSLPQLNRVSIEEKCF